MCTFAGVVLVVVVWQGVQTIPANVQQAAPLPADPLPPSPPASAPSDETPSQAPTELPDVQLEEQASKAAEVVDDWIARRRAVAQLASGRQEVLPSKPPTSPELFEPAPAITSDPVSQMVHCRRVLAEDPSDREANAAIARLLQSEGKLTEAVEHWRTVQELDPHNIEAFYECGKAAVKLQRWWEMRDCFERLTELEPDVTAHYYHLGIALGELGRHHESESAFRTALDRDSSMTPTINGLIAAIFQGRYQEAPSEQAGEEIIRLCRQSLNLADDQPDIQNLLEVMELQWLRH